MFNRSHAGIRAGKHPRIPFGVADAFRASYWMLLGHCVDLFAHASLLVAVAVIAATLQGCDDMDRLVQGLGDEVQEPTIVYIDYETRFMSEVVPGFEGS